MAWLAVYLHFEFFKEHSISLSSPPAGGGCPVVQYMYDTWASHVCLTEQVQAMSIHPYQVMMAWTKTQTGKNKKMRLRMWMDGKLTKSVFAKKHQPDSASSLAASRSNPA
jgi:hypothetical protein